MNGMKTCSEVFLYMNCSENRLCSRPGDGMNSLLEGYSKLDGGETAVSTSSMCFFVFPYVLILIT